MESLQFFKRAVIVATRQLEGLQFKAAALPFLPFCFA
jgi:hypothetical protein